MTPDNDLFKKFHANRLRPDELKQLREEINHMSDEDVDLRLLGASLDREETACHLDPDSSEALRERLTDEARRKNRRYRLYFRAGIAAAVMLPILMAVAVVLGVRVTRLDRYQKVIASEHVIRTGMGEEMLTVLPDGSRVRMAPESELCYSLSTYNDRERDVEWTGEGMFEVARNEESPFTVHAGDFDVRVLGTTFSVDVRRDSENAKVYLESGSIELSSLKGDYTCRLSPGCLATISRATGEITVRRVPDFNNDLGDRMLNFYDVSLADVLRRMELYYPRRFEAPADIAAQTFTGSLPKNNLDEALVILEKAYSLKATADTETVKLTRRQ